MTLPTSRLIFLVTLLDGGASSRDDPEGGAAAKRVSEMRHSLRPDRDPAKGTGWRGACGRARNPLPGGAGVPSDPTTRVCLRWLDEAQRTAAEAARISGLRGLLRSRKYGAGRPEKSPQAERREVTRPASLVGRGLPKPQGRGGWLGSVTLLGAPLPSGGAVAKAPVPDFGRGTKKEGRTRAPSWRREQDEFCPMTEDAPRWRWIERRLLRCHRAQRFIQTPLPSAAAPGW